VPIFEEAGEAGVVLVRRSDHLGKHAGQIAFPGGGRDPCEDELAAALRESQEEVGLPPDEVDIVGRLDRYSTITGYLVSPFVGRLRRWPLELVPDPGEVAEILAVPIRKLVEPGALSTAELGTGRTINFFEVGEQVIWGATARMLRQVLELSLGRPLEPDGQVPWDRVRW
jgi:8-oxo-dGTP pyrophosphatase MutT (NUDIX family)